MEETLDAHRSTGVEVFSMKLIIFSLTFTDLDLRANVILLTKDLTPLLSPGLLRESPCIVEKTKRKQQLQRSRNMFKMYICELGKKNCLWGELTSAELRLLWDPDVLTIQCTYEESRPSTFMSTRCCWRAKKKKSHKSQVSFQFLPNKTLQFVTRRCRILNVFNPLTHEASFSNADVFFVFL